MLLFVLAGAELSRWLGDLNNADKMAEVSTSRRELISTLIFRLPHTISCPQAPTTDVADFGRATTRKKGGDKGFAFCCSAGLAHHLLCWPTKCGVALVR